MLKKGVHFGHKAHKWHPSAQKFIHTTRNGVHIIDLQQTSDRLKKAIEFMEDSAKNNKVILFVGTKKSTKHVLKKHVLDNDIPYVSERWLGGTITNFASINGLVKKLEKLEEQASKSDYEDKYNKKERLMFSVEMKRLEKMVGGIRKLTSTPDVIFVTDVREEKTAIREAVSRNIPVVAIVDTNVNPDGISYPIPANDDSVKSVDCIVGLLAEAVVNGRAKAPKLSAPEKKSGASEKQSEEKEGKRTRETNTEEKAPTKDKPENTEEEVDRESKN